MRSFGERGGEQRYIETVSGVGYRFVAAVTAAAESAAAAAQRRVASIAVLPLADLSHDRDQGYFAEGIAEGYKQPMEAVLLQARDVGAAIVDEATERGADLLVVGLPYRKRFGGEFAIGRTIPYILQNAPCTVWVVREPMSEEPA